MDQRVLVVLPHPDDETFGCGGTIALLAKSGASVTYACGTLGEMGRNMGQPTFATRESLRDIREAELEAACDALGIQRLMKLGLRDKTVEFEDPAALADRIADIIRDVQPSLVITHYPGYAVHPDHNALGAATIRALAQFPAATRPVTYAHGFAKTDDLGPKDIVHDISSVSDVKLAAIRAHRSQSEPMLAQFERAKAEDGPISNMARSFLTTEAFWTYRFGDEER